MPIQRQYMTKLLTRLQLQFSLNSNFSDHTFHHNFKDCVSPICHCGAETAVLPLFANERSKLCDVYQINASIKNLNEKSLTDVLLHGSDRFNYSKSKQTLLHTICYIQATKYFERPLFDQCYFRSITTVVFFSNMPAKALSTI